MTGALDTKMRAVANTLIERFGKSVQWTSYTDSVSPTTGTVDRTASSNNVTISPPIGPNSAYEPNQLLDLGEFEVMLAASAINFTPKVGDEVDIDSVTYTSIAVDSIYSGSQIAAFRVRLRR